MPSWTEPYELQPDAGIAWDFGVRRIWCETSRGQLRLGWSDPERDELEDVEVSRYPGSHEHVPTVRIALPAPERVQLRVVPSPRPVVSRPIVPLTVPARSGAVVYVGVPVWLEVWTGPQLVAHLPAVRLSDTWFGDPTEGVLCFATRTHMRTELEAIPRRPFRTLCRVDIRNDTSEPFVVERIRIPAAALAIHESRDGVLWTSDLAYTLIERLDAARVQVVSGAPRSAVGAKPVAQPREAPLPLARVFNALWRSGQ